MPCITYQIMNIIYKVHYNKIYIIHLSFIRYIQVVSILYIIVRKCSNCKNRVRRFQTLEIYTVPIHAIIKKYLSLKNKCTYIIICTVSNVFV